jgi:LPXTG-motif cell wall-anchored protein
MKQEDNMRIKRPTLGAVVFAAALVVSGPFAIAGAAAADSTACGDVGCGSPAVSNTPQSGPATAGATATSPSAGSPSSGGLAFTGADIGEMSGLALGAVALGSGLVLASKRRRIAAA